MEYPYALNTLLVLNYNLGILYVYKSEQECLLMKSCIYAFYNLIYKSRQNKST